MTGAAILIAALLGAPLCAQPVNIDASKPAEAPKDEFSRMGGKAPDGRQLAVNSRYLTIDGVPWLPVMGEMHFSRYPERYWEEEILKMKAGGIRIVSTYVFWIHHEEIQGQFDWSGQRNLRRFVELCAKHGMLVWVRIGPWAHGECRNGGFPDWLLKACPTRQNDPAYLKYVGRLYGEIGRQLKGLFWKDGGPIIGVQLENEYAARGPGKGAAHFLELKRLAREAGIEAPFYTVTGWGHPDFPPREVMPVFGGYPDAFWDRALGELPPSPHYFFNAARCDDNIGSDLKTTNPSEEAKLAAYPFLTAEMGGGMEVAYHRRPIISAEDVGALVLTKLGSGVALYGYYMFHGGANPQGKLTTLQESRATGYPNDLPVVSYDFQAPLGEFGEMRPSFRVLKTFHLFLQDFGSYLAPMTPFFPDRMPEGVRDSATPRAAARMNGGRGFVFFTNYQRNYPLPPRRAVQVTLKTPSETLAVPRHPVDVPTDDYFIWPVNLDLNGATLKYATAQLLCKLERENTYFFFAVPGIPPEFVFDPRSVSSVEGNASRIVPGSGVALTVHPKGGKTVRIVVLTRAQAENCWKAFLGSREFVLLSEADLSFEGMWLYLRSRDAGKLAFSAYPDLDRTPIGMVPIRQRGRDGIFTRYAASVPSKSIGVTWEKTRDGSPSVPVKMPEGYPLAPDDSDFSRAGVWQIHVAPGALAGVSDVFLRIQYAGDAGRIYAGSRLLDDNFYNGTDWEIGLKRFGDEVLRQGLQLKVLPLRKDMPIYIPQGSWPAFPESGEAAVLNKIVAFPEYEVTMAMGSGQ